MNIKTIELSGIIQFEYHSYYKIKLVQQDGYKIDLVTRFQEASESFPDQKIQVNYYLSDKSCTKDEMIEGFLKKLFGAIEAEYEKNDYRYSSWTAGTDYDTTLTIGGHDLYNELLGEQGMFIILELNFQEND